MTGTLAPGRLAAMAAFTVVVTIAAALPSVRPWLGLAPLLLCVAAAAAAHQYRMAVCRDALIAIGLIAAAAAASAVIT